MRAIAFVVSLSALVSVASLSAQMQASVEPGARVRVTAPACNLDRRAGTLEATRGDTLVLADGDFTSRCLQSDVTRFEVSQGRKGHPWRGAGIGFVSGVVLGSVIGYGECGSDCPHETGALILGGIGALVGPIVGAIVGSRIKTDRWEEIPLDQLRVGLAPQRDGRLGIGWSVVF